MNKYIYTRWLFIVLLATASCKKPDFEAQQQAQAAGTISDYLTNNFDFSLFAAAVRKAGLMDSLNQATATLTVMAPTNTALNKDSIYNASDFDKWPADSLRYFVRTHILPIKLFYNTIPLSSDNRYDNLNNTRLYISRSKDISAALTVNGVNVQKQPSLGTTTGATYGITQLNGVIYPLPNTIKVVPVTVQAFLLARPQFSHLVAGLRKFGYWDQLATDGPFTLYAPMDSSFERRGITLDSISRIDVNRIDPVVFGGYFLKPNHLFVLDMLQLPPPAGTIYLAFQCPDVKYKLIMTQQPFGSGVGIVTAASTATRILVLVGPNASKPYGEQGTLFLGETSNTIFMTTLNGIYTNYTCTNGVVHLLSDLLVMPDKVSR
ncbi:fasciclin domain-containing protein [Chitinophaga polysaccharea]|uniref:Fasciclin domain-containing protein n=1 Tax=Chitinophaga polysaccharea TaxID=1293035 RepID=A0A561PP97_9BACT|nr:fasciclin domain-containing protein [Chitinophaga polysaccharea]TWF39930.1 fasciclin domain-containing protein [Chitinophaga polysaccharea]